jgi:hypothetical protein
MDSWETQRESAKAAIAEIEGKIALQTQRTEELRSQNKDASVPLRLISVLQENLARARMYAEYIVTAQDACPETCYAMWREFIRICGS